MIAYAPGRRRLQFATFAAIAFGLPASATAATPAALDRVNIAIGGYVVRPDLNLSVNTQAGSVTTGDVSAHQITLPRAHAEFLLGERQGFAFDYYGFSRRYSDSLNQAVSVGGGPGSISAAATAEVGIDIGNAAYRWWFGGDNSVLGLGVGLAYYRINLNANANAASTIGGVTGSASGTYSHEAYAPLLQLGLRHAFDANTRVYVDASGVKKSGGALSGHIYNASLGAEWYPLRNLGFGAEYGITRVKVDDANNGARLDAKLDGPSVFLKARF